jgi:hypothetical protein
MIERPLLGLPGLPHEGENPVFKAPWEARAFAMVIRLHERGLFTWTEWAEAAERTPHGSPIELPSQQ